MNLLEQNNIITGTKVDSDYKNKLVSSKFAEYRKHVMPINRFLHKISVGSSSNDATINTLQQDLAKIVSKSLMSEIRHHIANPIAHEGVHQSGLIGKITDKIEIGISNLREALKSLENTEGSIIIDFNSDEYSAVSHPKVDGKKLKHHPNSIEEAAGQRVISAIKREQEDLIGKYLTSEAGSKIPQFNSVTELIEVNPPTSGPNALINELLETSPIRNILVANNINYDTTLGINNSITTTMGIGFSLFEEANAGANVTPVRANVSLPMIEAMAIKYGPKVYSGAKSVARLMYVNDREYNFNACLKEFNNTPFEEWKKKFEKK